MENASLKVKYTTSVIIYGTIGMILRFISFPSELVVFSRGLIGSIFIALFLRYSRKSLDKKAIKHNLKFLIISGICLGLNWVFLFAAYMHTTVAIASLCNYTAPVIVVALSPFLYKEKIAPLKIVCIFTSVLGVVFVSGIITEGLANINLIGIALGLCAAICFVFLVIFNKKIEGISSYDKSVMQLSISALTVLPYVILNNIGKPIEINLHSLILTALLGVFHTGIAYILYFGSMPLLPVNDVAILGYLEPAVSVLCSIFILKEKMDIFGLLGALLIIGSAIISEVRIPHHKFSSSE